MLTIHAEIVSMAISSPKVNVLQDQTIKEIAALLMVVMAPVFNAVPVCTPQILTAPETRSTAAFWRKTINAWSADRVYPSIKAAASFQSKVVTTTIKLEYVWPANLATKLSIIIAILSLRWPTASLITNMDVSNVKKDIIWHLKNNANRTSLVVCPIGKRNAQLAFLCLPWSKDSVLLQVAKNTHLLPVLSVAQVSRWLKVDARRMVACMWWTILV